MSSLPNKDRKKTPKDDDCVICLEPAFQNVLECLQCDSRFHASCIGGNSCVQALPAAFKCYENDASLVDSRVSAVEISDTKY